MTNSLVRHGHSKPTDSSVCLLPDCTTAVDFPDGAGRARLFCGPFHRKRYDRDRKWLIEQLREARTLRPDNRRAIARLEWHLQRYPAVEQRGVEAGEDVQAPTRRLDGPESILTPPIDPLLWLLLVDPATAVAVAGNVHTPTAVLDYLSNLPSAKVRAKVAGNQATDPATLEVLCSDPTARVREVAARNPITPVGARRRALRDRARRVRDAAMSPEPVVDWALYDRARASEKLRTATSQQVADALAAVVADTIVTYLDVPFDSVPELSRSVQRILGPIANHPHVEPSIRVQRELTEKLYSHRLQTPSPARPDGYRRQQPRHANTVEAWTERVLSDIGECYELPDTIKMHVRRELAPFFADLGVVQHD